MSLRSARRRDLRLVPVALAAWIAAAIATRVPDAAGLAAPVLWCGAVLFLGLAARRTRGRTPLAVVAVTLAIAGSVTAHVAVALPDRAAAAAVDLDGGRFAAVTAHVVGKVERSATGWRFDALATHIAYGAEGAQVDAPVLVRVAERPDGLDLGAGIVASGTAFPAAAGERAVLVVRASTIEVRHPPEGPLAAAAQLRRGLVDAVAGLPQPAAGLIPGLSVGETSAVTDELDAQMKGSSLSHLTAVSGANCALVVGIAFAAAAACGARRSVRVLAGLVVLAGFVLLVSPEPSVVRAGAMAGIAMLGLLLGRIGAGVSVLCLAVALLLLIDPWLAGSLGFALSAAATGSLLLAAGPIAEGLARAMPHPLALAISVPLAAQLACGPLLVLIAPTVPVYGVLANLIAAPAAPAGTVLGLLACLAAPIPALAQGLAALAWLPAAWVASTAAVATALPGSSLPWLEDWPGLFALAAVGAAIGILAAPPTSRRVVRRLAVAVVAATAGILLAVGPIAGAWERARTPAHWAVVACDVGQGDAVLIRSQGQTMLVDTGPDGDALEGCLSRFGVSRLDVVVLTHFDLDHRGGAEAVIGRTGLLVHGPAGSVADEQLIARFADGGAALIAAHADQTGTLGDCAWRVLWPRAGGSGTSTGNDASVVMEVTGCAVPSTLLLGDLSAQAQRAMLSTGRVRGPYDIVKVAHHGSADQEPALYLAAAARLALLTVGDNSYGHPRTETLDLLAENGSVLARTDVNGSVAVWTADGALRVWRSQAAAPDTAPG